MILKRNFSPLKVWGYIKAQMWPITGWSLLVWAGYSLAKWQWLTLNFTPVGVLGSALAIFVAFRNNAAYSRWWEARTLWGNVENSSRVLARQLLANAGNAVAAGKASADMVRAFEQEMLYRQIAFAHAMRLHLRQQDSWHEVFSFLPPAEAAALEAVPNKPNQLLLTQAIRIKDAMRQEILGPFDNISLEPTLAGLNNWQGACERIKNTPLPRQYDFFTRIFVGVIAFLLPMGLLGLLAAGSAPAWLSIPLTVLVAGVFVVMERTGAANEAPFENQVTDVPLTALCNTIERDLKSMLGEPLPQELKVVDGYLM
jgi:putative membrane protein